MIDGVSVGAVLLRDLVGPITVSTDRGRRQIDFDATAELPFGSLHLSFSADSTRSTHWPD